MTAWANGTDDGLVVFDGDRICDNRVENGHERKGDGVGYFQDTHSYSLPLRLLQPLFYVTRFPGRDELDSTCLLWRVS